MYTYMNLTYEYLNKCLGKLTWMPYTFSLHPGVAETIDMEGPQQFLEMPRIFEEVACLTDERWGDP